MDDCLKSVPSPSEAIQLIKELCQLLARHLFRLTKIVSNDREVIESVPETDRVKSVANLDFSELPIERALGVHWKVDARCLHLSNNQEKECPYAQRDPVRR